MAHLPPESGPRPTKPGETRFWCSCDPDRQHPFFNATALVEHVIEARARDSGHADSCEPLSAHGMSRVTSKDRPPASGAAGSANMFAAICMRFRGARFLDHERFQDHGASDAAPRTRASARRQTTPKSLIIRRMAGAELRVIGWRAIFI
jgi:hypothetical protein